MKDVSVLIPNNLMLDPYPSRKTEYALCYLKSQDTVTLLM